MTQIIAPDSKQSTSILKGNRLMSWLLVLSAILVLAVFALGCHFGVWNLIVRQPGAKKGHIEWEALGPTPMNAEKYTPQGLTFADGDLVFANSWKNTKSRIYRIGPESMAITATFDMPDEAVHTSGLAYDAPYLWAVDNISNRCYKIDMEKSFVAGKAEVVGSFATGLKGTSACGFLSYKGEQLLAISDFMRQARTYIVRADEAVLKEQMQDSTVFSYSNEGFSQGLVWDGCYLYESENKLGINVINQMDIDKLSETGSARKATIRQFNAPSKSVEDLAWDGEYIYTSDEAVFMFYQGRIE